MRRRLRMAAVLVLAAPYVLLWGLPMAMYVGRRNA